MVGRVAIVGGGLAGLSAMVRLVEAQYHVTLFESRPILGGRAGSFLDPTTNQLTDNCQHVTLHCCTYLDDFCQRIAVDHLFRHEKTLHFINPSGKISQLRAGLLPAPLHLTGSFLKASFISWSDKLRIALGMWSMMRQPTNPVDDSVEQWLRRHFQTDQTIERFWNVVLVSALNESLDTIDYQYARQVFVTGMLSNKSAMTMSVPTVSLSELYHQAILNWARVPTHRDRVELRLGTPAKLITRAHGSANQLAIATGQGQGDDAEFGHVILAVPWHRTCDLLSDELRSAELAEQLSALGSSPITSVHCWFDSKVMSTDHLVVVGRATQWLFRRLHDGPGEYVQAVISASDRLAGLSNDAVKSLIVEEIMSILPAARSARLEHSRVVTERHATYSVTPGVDRYRPAQSTSIGSAVNHHPGVILAGDYTATGWPATMEGAVKSGVLAANAVFKRDSLPDAPSVAPLPPSWLAKLLIR